MAYTKDPPTYGKKPPCYGPTGGIGDIGGDGRIASDDLASIIKVSTGDLILSEREKIRADLDGNGVPGDAVDVALMSKFSVGDITTFPVCAKKGYPTEPPTYGTKPPCYGPTGGIGDIGGDGRIASDDLASMIKVSTGDTILSGRESIRADLDGNGVPGDAVDVGLMIKHSVGDITTFPVCSAVSGGGIDPITTPDMRSLEPGVYNIVISKSGYDTVHANITVSSTGQVSCNDVVGVTGCGSDYPRVMASGSSVSIHMATSSGGGTSGYDTWLTSIGGINNVTLANIMDLKKKFIGLQSTITFTPTLSNIIDCKKALIGL